MLGSILGFIGGPIMKWLEGRAAKKKVEAERMLEIARAETEVKIAKAQAAAEIERKKATAEVDWERIWAEQAAKSWKDEFYVIFLSIPVAMAFIPGLSDEALHGFQIIDMMPNWFKGAFLTAIGASFGVRHRNKFFTKRK